VDVPFADGERGESESDSQDDALVPGRSGVPVAVSEDRESSHDREVDCRRERGSVILHSFDDRNSTGGRRDYARDRVRIEG
jgi:hypothetical protein